MSLKLLAREDVKLKLNASEIDNLEHPEFQNFIDDLIRCGEESDGVGIAAPQVGQSIRLFIMAPRPNPRYPDAPIMEPTAIINPEILFQSDEKEKGWEGCLSVPGFRGMVPRSNVISVTYTDRFGKKHAEQFTGFLARLFLHEFDHLEGVLFPDRMEKEDSLVTLEEYAALTGIVVSK